MGSFRVISGLIAAAMLAPGAVSPARAAGPTPRILLVGDSTVSTYKPDMAPQMGWGMLLPCSISPRVEVRNLSRGGRSTRSFREEGLWYGVLAIARPGDTVLIQFGHNDEDRTKMYRHAEPDDYAANLTRFVADVRAKGAAPVLVTPVARAEFADGHAKDTHGAYSAAVRRVASDTHTPLIDLDAEFRALLDQAGEAKASRLFLIYAPTDHVARFPQGHRDTTHLNEAGARAAADIVAHDLAGLALPVSQFVGPGRRARVGDGAVSCPRGIS